MFRIFQDNRSESVRKIDSEIKEIDAVIYNIKANSPSAFTRHARFRYPHHSK